MAFSFFGGIHPRENKWYACDRETQPFPAPDILVVPMSQHIGAPCKPLVKQGDPVAVGQKIGDNHGLCVPVHAPVSGRVLAVAPRLHTYGTTVMSVVIENDHKNTLWEGCKGRTREEVAALDPEALIGIIREGGIAGMGGATFPTHEKLALSIGKVNTVIVNACECEPYITADDRLCREQPQKIIAGLKLVMQILGLSQGHISIEDNKPEAFAILEAALDKDDDIILDLLPTRYPQGAERQLIYAVTGREVPSGSLPSAVGCVVFNAATIKAIYDVVYEGMPLTHRIVTVSGDILEEPKNLLAPIGTAFHDLIEACGLREAPRKILSGGPMMGVAQYDASVPVIKGVSAITVLGRASGYATGSRCLRCGKCIDVCPMKLMPVLMYKALESGDIQRMKDANISDCTECGCCAYICPAALPLVPGFRKAKQLIRDDKR